MSLRLVACFLYILGIPVALAGDQVRKEATVRLEVRVAGGATKDGPSVGKSGRFDIPEQCEYVSHDVEILERVPAAAGVASDASTAFEETVQRSRSGRVTSVRLFVFAARAERVGEPQPKIAASLVTVVRCDEVGIAKLRTLGGDVQVAGSE